MRSTRRSISRSSPSASTGSRRSTPSSLYVDPGELLCIIGPNGAGKTTMMDVVTGKTRPESGTAWFGRHIDLLELTEPEIAQAGIGRKFQKPTVFEYLTCSRTSSWRWPASKSFWKALVARLHAAQRERIDKASTASGLTDLRRRAGEDALARSEAMARDRDAADAGAGAAAGRRARGRHDAARRRSAPRNCWCRSPASTRSSSSNTTWTSCDRLPSGSPSCTKGACSRKGDMDQVQNDQRVIEVYLGE